MGHASIIRPPLAPQPVTPETSEVGVMLKAMVVVRPVIVTVEAEVHVLAAMAVVPIVMVVFDTTVPMAFMTNASVAILVELSPEACVVAVVPFGSAGVPLKFAAVPTFVSNDPSPENLLAVTVPAKFAEPVPSSRVLL